MEILKALDRDEMDKKYAAERSVFQAREDAQIQRLKRYEIAFHVLAWVLAGAQMFILHVLYGRADAVSVFADWNTDIAKMRALSFVISALAAIGAIFVHFDPMEKVRERHGIVHYMLRLGHIWLFNSVLLAAAIASAWDAFRPFPLWLPLWAFWVIAVIATVLRLVWDRFFGEAKKAVQVNERFSDQVSLLRWMRDTDTRNKQSAYAKQFAEAFTESRSREAVVDSSPAQIETPSNAVVAAAPLDVSSAEHNALAPLPVEVPTAIIDKLVAAEVPEILPAQSDEAPSAVAAPAVAKVDGSK